MSTDKPIALEERAAAQDARLFSPSAGRNQAALAEALAGLLAPNAHVLEIGAGTGEHAVAVVSARPDLHWRPTDPDPASRASIAAWAAHAGLAQIAAPIALDARDAVWPVERSVEGREGDAPFDAVVSINMIHIAPWAAAEGLLAGAGRVLRAGGVLALYGPFSEGGVHTAPSNADFDASLKQRDPDWGVRDLDQVAATAAPHGLALDRTIAMPANNRVVVLRRG